MKVSSKTFSISKKFIALLLFFSFLFVADSYLITRKGDSFKQYTEMEHRLSLLLTDIVRVEYMLDIFVVARHLEEGVPEAIERDVKKIDEEIKEVVKFGKNSAFIDSSVYKGIVSSVKENWAAVKEQIERLDTVETEEEALLVHNSVDTHTMMLREDIERFMSLMEEQANASMKKRRNYILFALFTSLALCLGAGGIFLYKVLLPLDRFYLHMLSTLKGRKDEWQGEIKGDIGGLAEAFNTAMAKMEELRVDASNKFRYMEERVKQIEKKMASIKNVTTILAGSISQYEVFMEAIAEVMRTEGASACAVYVKDGPVYRLSVSKGFSKTFFYRAESFPARERDSFQSLSPLVFRDVARYPEGKLKSILLTEDIKSYICVPILYGEEVRGYFDVAFREEFTPEEEDLLYLQSIAIHCGVAIVHSLVCLGERSKRVLMERIIEHMPFGVAVFDREGTCVLINDGFKRFLGCDVRCELRGSYNLFEDDYMEELGIMPEIKKVYEGGMVEVIATPHRLHNGKKVRVVSCPVYEAGGSISYILIVCDCIKEEL